MSLPLVLAINPGGTLALSGILSKELEQVREHFIARFGELRSETPHTDSRIDGEWADLRIQISK